MKSKVFLCPFFLLIFSAHAQSGKDQYHLFNPTPENQMRGLNTDRPDKTETPHTVDAGHFQLETDILAHSYNRERNEDQRTRLTGLPEMNFKVGLTNHSDFQLIISPYVEQEKKADGIRTEKKGLGETLLRYKHNLYGNDEGHFAIGLLPFLKLPTAGAGLGSDHAEGGMAIPINVKIAPGWDLGTMAQVGNERRDHDQGSQTSYVLTLTMGYPIWGELGGFVELYSKTSDNRRADPESTLDIGLTYMLSPKVQLDTGVFLGLTDAAEDYKTFTGLSALF